MFEDSSKIIITAESQGPLAKVLLSDYADMCYGHLYSVFGRLNMLPVSRFQNFLCPGSDDGSSSKKGGRWNVSKVYCQ